MAEGTLDTVRSCAARRCTGELPAPPVPHCVVKQGEPEDWIIENRVLEVHVFHSHQIHVRQPGSATG